VLKNIHAPDDTVGDRGLVELEAADRYAALVSRSRVGWLKSRIARLDRAAEQSQR
jgi:hypothetical protein